MTLQATIAKRQAVTRKRTSSAVEQAKAAGARGPHGSDSQRALRDTAIIARAEGGAASRDIAAEFGVSERTVRAVLAKRQQVRSPLDDLPAAILEDLARAYTRAIADFTVMAYRWSETAPAVSLGALKAAQDARGRYAELLVAAGVMPENMSLLRSQSMLEQIADRMIEALELVQAGELQVADAVEVFRRLVEQPARTPARPALKAV